MQRLTRGAARAILPSMEQTMQLFTWFNDSGRGGRVLADDARAAYAILVAQGKVRSGSFNDIVQGRGWK